MKLNVQRVMDATLVLATIINERRPMPQRGKYLIARLHAKLLPEFKIIDGRRDEMIKAYNNPQMRTDTNPETGSTCDVPIDGMWQVPPYKVAEFTAAWKVIADEEIEIDTQAIPLAALSLPDGSNGAIEANEIVALGDFIAE